MQFPFPPPSARLASASVLGASLSLLAACGGGVDGSDGSNLVVDNGPAPSTAARTAPLTGNDPDCPNGGIEVQSGIDENKNGELDDDEVDNTQKVCNGEDGADGLDALVRLSQEPAGANCPYKGIRIDSGQDVNGNGQLDAGEITDTQYACNLIDGQIGWQVATRIGSETPYYYSYDPEALDPAPQIAVDANGNAIAIWEQSDSLWANRYVPGTGWGTAELIQSRDMGFINYPQLAVDANGNAIAVWQQSDGWRGDIWANRYLPGFGWGSAEPIETDNLEHAFWPQIAMDPSGNVIAVWQQLDDTQTNVWANRYVPGTGWGTAQLIETNDTGDANNPQIAFDANGNAIAVWGQYDGTRYNIWANRYAPATGWGTAELIETNDTGDARHPQIAFDANGNAIAVWQQSDGTRFNIWANRYVPGTGWGTAQLIETDDAGHAGVPQIAFDANGNAIAVWLQGDGERFNIWANRYVPGTGWGTAQLIETDNAGDAIYPQIAVDTNGNAIAVWQQSDGTRYNIWANRYVPGTGWANAELIETNSEGDSFSPQIAMDPSGNVMVVWKQTDGTTYNIWANRWLAP